MTCFSINRMVPCLVLSFIFILFYTQDAATALFANSDKDLMKNISLIAVLEGENETSVVVRGDGEIPAHMTQTIEFPPRIIIDIFCETPSFETITRAVSSSILKSIRVGHHPKAVRLVLDVNGADIPNFSSIKKSSELIIT